jgi:hypothetical protein
MRMGSMPQPCRPHVWLRLIIVEMYAIVFFMSKLLVVDWYVHLSADIYYRCHVIRYIK